MSEQRRQPEEESPRVTFELPGGKVEARPENAAAYLHPRNLQHFDHVYIQMGSQDDPRGAYLFRAHLNNFDDVIQYMKHNGFRVTRSAHVDPHDREVHDTMFRVPTTPERAPEPPKSRDLTPRQERTVQYLHYLLEHGHLTPTDFVGRGDLEL